MNGYIETSKLITEIKVLKSVYGSKKRVIHGIADGFRQDGMAIMCDIILKTIDSLQQAQPNNMIQWTGNNLKEVIDFTGKSPRFEEWFKSWEEFETYVHKHNDILKLFCEDGSHYEVPVGAWIVRTPDGYNVPSVAKYIQKEQPDNLASLISEATNVAKRIIDWDSFYNSLPQNLRNKYTSKAWSEILEALSTMGGQEQPEVDLEKEINNAGMAMTNHNPSWKEIECFARHFYELGLNAKKGEE